MGLKRDLKLILVLLFFAFANSSAEQATFYIASNRNDTNPGTKDMPWKTVKALNNCKFVPGDTVFFARGSIFRGGFVVSSSGEPEKPIVFTSSELLTSRKLNLHHFIDKFQIGVGINSFGFVQDFAQFRNSTIGTRRGQRMQSHR